jgi:NitT/TauT family transport system ATP-binding protein
MFVKKAVIVKNLTKSFFKLGREIPVLRNVNLTVDEGEFVSVIGPSGCGKSTLLNIISGLLRPTSGEVFVDGERVIGPCTKVGYMFQSDVLLPWRTAIANVELGLEIRNVDKEERRKMAETMIKRVGLSGFEHHYPHELSGGMRQRVALARTLVLNPTVLLMDEPFGALDAQTRMLLGNELLRLWREYNKTIIFVTHDLSEAISLAQRVVVLSKRPGTIKAQYSVDLPEPRDVTKVVKEASFLNLYSTIWNDLAKEISGG